MKKSPITPSLYVLIGAAMLSSFAFIGANQKPVSHFKAKVTYTLADVTYLVDHDQLRKAFEEAKDQTYLKLGSALSNTLFFNERTRLTKVATQVNPNFKEQQLTFLVDTMKTIGKYSVKIKVTNH